MHPYESIQGVQKCPEGVKVPWGGPRGAKVHRYGSIPVVQGV